MYQSVSTLAAFELLSSAAKCRTVLQLVRAFVAANKEILHEAAAWGTPLPPLYHSGVRYEFQRDTDKWKDAWACLMSGMGSCNSLAAWRCAELQLAGEAATPYVQHQVVRKPNGEEFDLFHVIVHRGDGAALEWEDPSRTLGMPSEDPSMLGARVVSASGWAGTVGDAGAIPGVWDEEPGGACWGS